MNRISNFFNPNIAFDPANQQAWDDQALTQQVAQRRAIAQALMQQGDMGGQMVSGWYVAPSKGQAFAKMLAAGLGGYGMGKTVKAENNITSGNADALRFAQGLMKQTPMDQLVKQAEEANPMLTHTYNKPEEVGPPIPEELAPASTSPVGSGSVTMTNEGPLARAKTAASAVDPAARVGTEKGRATSTVVAPSGSAPRTQVEVGAALDAARAERKAAYDNLYGPNKWGSVQKARDPQGFVAAQNAYNAASEKVRSLEKEWEATITSDQLAGRTPVPGLPVAPAPAPAVAATTSAATPASTSIPPLSLGAPSAPSPAPATTTPEAPPPTFNIDTAAQERIDQDRVGFLRRAIAAEQERRAEGIELLGRAGDRGRRMADRIMGADERIAVARASRDPWKTTDGAVINVDTGKVIRGNRKVSSTVDTPDGQLIVYQDGSRELVSGVRSKAQAERESDNRQKIQDINSSLGELNRTRAKIAEIITGNIPEQATGLSGKFGRAAAGLGFSNQWADASQELEGLTSRAINGVINAYQSQGMSVSQLMNTQIEALRAAQSQLNLAYQTQSEDAVRKALREYDQALNRVEGIARQELERRGGTSAPAPSSGGFQFQKAPQ